MNKITDYTTRARSVLLEQLKKQYGPYNAVSSVFSSSVPAVSSIAKITDYSTRVVSPILEQLKKQYGGMHKPATPVADFDYVIDGLNVLFTDKSTGVIDSWVWDFGSGAIPETATTQGPHSVSYSASGTKTISLTVTNISGSDTITKEIQIEPVLVLLSWWKGDNNALDSVGEVGLALQDMLAMHSISGLQEFI